MPRTFPLTIINAINNLDTDRQFLVLLEVSHEGNEPVRLVNDTDDLVYQNNTYVGFPFAINLPSDSEEIVPRFQVVVQNATRPLVAEVRRTAGTAARPTVNVHIISLGPTQELLVSWENFEMVNVRYTVDVMEFELVLETFLNEPFPAESFTPNNFPAIF